MASPTNGSGKTGWKPGHIPKLSYRNPLPPGEEVPYRESPSESPTPKSTKTPGLSIREIRQNLPQQFPQMSSPAPLPSPPIQEGKSRRSKLKGFFASEPSTAAFLNLQQTTLATHGAISPSVMPHVSSAKMPDYVPRVNSKWDGVPDYIKMREKQEREREKYEKRGSFQPVNSRSLSSEFPDDQSVIRRRNSNAGSAVESWDSLSTESRARYQDTTYARPASICSTSSGGSGRPGKRPISSKSPSYRSPHDRTPETTLHSLDETPTPPRGPQRIESAHSTSTESTSSSTRGQILRSPGVAPSPIDASAGYTSSSATTPLERSPRTPAPLLEDENSLENLIRGDRIHSALRSDGKSTSASKKNVRTGLGLQTSSQIAPWESQTLPNAATQKLQADALAKSRYKVRAFGKDKK